MTTTSVMFKMAVKEAVGQVVKEMAKYGVIKKQKRKRKREKAGNGES